MTDDVVISFGKHKGCSIIEVMATDPQYIEWLKLQPWFVDKFQPIYNIIVQAGPPSEMTPEHNAMQVRFLDDDVCRQVVLQVLPGEEQITIGERIMEEIADVAFTASDT